MPERTLTLKAGPYDGTDQLLEVQRPSRAREFAEVGRDFKMRTCPVGATVDMTASESRHVPPLPAGDSRGGGLTDQPGDTPMNVPSAPARLQFRLRGFNENESTDDFLQGANDEVWMSAAGLDSSSVKVGPDHQPVADIVRTQPLGDVSDDAVRGPWKTQPHVLMEFDLRQPGDFPRTYTVTLFIVEHDNGDLQKAFEELEQRVGPQIKAAAVAAAVAAGTAVGAAVGSAVPGIGTAVGAAVGALAGLAYDGVVKAIDDGLADDVFTPIPVTLTVGNLSLLGQQPGVGTEQSLKVREHGADYDVIYDWNVVLAPADQPMPAAPSDVVQALAAMGVDFSVPETDLRGW
ncbi:hypothetical protein, partial [Streptomyces fungicidicus]|uniref:hypothetical protein n=1 Tax=Streptomyces fungicidicus TaxID=68203 RepID=UPI00368EF869